jgi:hypothetical protein
MQHGFEQCCLADAGVTGESGVADVFRVVGHDATLL